MARTESTMVELGSPAIEFELPNTNPDFGTDEVALSDFDGAPALLVVFMCNHCPFVIHVRDALRDFIEEYQPKGLAAVAISANDVTTHPDDSPHKMGELARQNGFTFPYLYDESQSVARAYGAACTPDFFLYDAGRRLVYRGRFDGATPGNRVPVTGTELAAAVDALLSGGDIVEPQLPSVGCNIKWRSDGAPS